MINIPRSTVYAGPRPRDSARFLLPGPDMQERDLVAAVLCVVSIISGGSAPGPAAAAQKLETAPHIITILTDDQGFGDSSYNCENSTGMCPRTPNLDALALDSHSALFSRFYAAAGVCSPTRAAYLVRENALRCSSSLRVLKTQGRHKILLIIRLHNVAADRTN